VELSFREYVRSYSKSGHVRCNSGCPLWAKSRHVQRKTVCLLKSGDVRCTYPCLLWANSGHWADHSITSSARASTAGGITRPNAFAVLRLISSSFLVGACTASSEGFSPLRMRST
jgi:hypothetical protein